MAHDVGIVWDIGQIRTNLAQLTPKMDSAIAALFSKKALDVQSYARRTAPWTDHTGNARQGLFAVATRENGAHVITLSHSVPYGIWLEVRFAGRHAVVLPTIRQMGPEVLKATSGLLARLGSAA